MRLSLYVRRMQQRKAFSSPLHERAPSSTIREFIVEPVIHYSDVNARVRFPGRFTIRAAVNSGASRADLEPTLGWFLNKELLMSIGPKQAPSSITLEQKLQDLCETNFRCDRISQSVANARCTLLNCFGLLVVRGQGFHWDTSLAALSFEICPASAAIHRSKHGSH